MRCTRCDRIAVPQAVGRTEDGLLVFGWCLDCLAVEGCREVAIAPSPGPPWRRWRRRLGRIWTHRRRLADRRLALLGFAGLLMVWALILTSFGLFGAPGPFRDGGRFYLGGGGALALVSLAAWAAMLGRPARARFSLKVVQVAGAAAAFSTLAWGLIRHRPARDHWIIAIAAAALAVSWAAHRIERRRTSAPRRPRASVP